jgi:hypothetical protein
VYLLKDRHGKVVYVGKAVNLRAALRSYLRGGDERSQVEFLLRQLADFETLVAASEKEALILENNLIKQYRPRYNIRLKDDKSYVSVKITLQDPWPRVLVTRKLVRDGSRYLGRSTARLGARDAGYRPQGVPAAHLQRRRVPQPRRGRASSTTSSAASARACCRSTGRSTASISGRRCC